MLHGVVNYTNAVYILQQLLVIPFYFARSVVKPQILIAKRTQTLFAIHSVACCVADMNHAPELLLQIDPVAKGAPFGENASVVQKLFQTISLSQEITVILVRIPVGDNDSSSFLGAHDA